MITRAQWLKMLVKDGGESTEYPFIEMGYERELYDLERDELVIIVPVEGGLGKVHITDKGRAYLHDMNDDTM